jgi:hypothetical protein
VDRKKARTGSGETLSASGTTPLKPKQGLSGPPGPAVEGKGVIDVSIWGQQNSMTAHLVNLTNPMMMKGPVRELFPIPAQTVKMRVPAGRQVKAARLLVAGGTAAYRMEEDFVVVDVPSVTLHEVVAVDLA